jgi:hypothetical protein
MEAIRSFIYLEAPMGRLSRFVGLGILGIVLVVGIGVSGDTKKDKAGKKPGIPPGWKALMLSKDQYTKVVGIAADYGTKITQLQAKIDALKQERLAEQVKVLTSEQKAILLKGLTGEAKDKPPSKTK